MVLGPVKNKQTIVVPFRADIQALRIARVTVILKCINILSYSLYTKTSKAELIDSAKQSIKTTTRPDCSDYKGVESLQDMWNICHFKCFLNVFKFEMNVLQLVCQCDNVMLSSRSVEIKV